jgi:hypothetical protein
LPPVPGPRTPLVEQAILSLLCSGLSMAATYNNGLATTQASILFNLYYAKASKTVN